MLLLTMTSVSASAAGSTINLELSKKIPPPLLSALLECTCDELIMTTEPVAVVVIATPPPLPAKSMVTRGFGLRWSSRATVFTWDDEEDFPCVLVALVELVVFVVLIIMNEILRRLVTALLLVAKFSKKCTR